MSFFNKDFSVVYLRVYQGCNLNCSHCFTLGDKDPMKETPMEYVNDYLDVIRERVNPKKATFYIHGGETFLASRDYLRDVNLKIRNTFRDTKIDIVPQTNLTYSLDDSFIDFLKQEYRGTIGVSWDADIRFRNLNQELRFFNNLKKLLDNGIKVHVAITVQKHLLKHDPISIVNKFHGVDSIDFELLTPFDDRVKELKVNNLEWSKWLDKVVEYYQFNDTTWALPMVDLLVKSVKEEVIHDCKCNCCDKRTFTLNPDGSVGLCPDRTYIEPLSTTTSIKENWEDFEKKAIEVSVDKLIRSQSETHCFQCEHFEICGGNCESELFDETDECPLSRRTIQRIKDNLPVFEKKYREKALMNLTELRNDYGSESR